MSKFLGPIHHWLYNKIELQNNINKQIATLNDTYASDTASYLLPPLESAVDTTNIHGWLQQKIDFVEQQLAYNVYQYTAKNSSDLTPLQQIFYSAGKSIVEERNSVTPKEFYQLLNDTLLDGMPCDHVNRLIEETEKSVTYQKTSCVHKKYWESIGADPEVFYNLRDELIRGMADNLEISHTKILDNTFVIERV